VHVIVHVHVFRSPQWLAWDAVKLQKRVAQHGILLPRSPQAGRVHDGLHQRRGSVLLTDVFLLRFNHHGSTRQLASGCIIDDMFVV
jgi:hypothetical protein